MGKVWCAVLAAKEIGLGAKKISKAHALEATAQGVEIKRETVYQWRQESET